MYSKGCLGLILLFYYLLVREIILSYNCLFHVSMNNLIVFIRCSDGDCFCLFTAAVIGQLTVLFICKKLRHIHLKAVHDISLYRRTILTKVFALAMLYRHIRLTLFSALQFDIQLVY